MILLSGGGQYESPMIRNTAAKVREVARYGVEVCSSSIDDVQSDQEGFDDVCRAHELIDKYILTCGKYHKDVQRNLRKVEFNQYGSRNIKSSILLFMADRMFIIWITLIE
jgi:hypothetical protein